MAEFYRSRADQEQGYLPLLVPKMARGGLRVQHPYAPADLFHVQEDLVTGDCHFKLTV